MTKVTALVQIRMGTSARPQIKARGETFDIDKAEAERLLNIGAVSIGGETGPRAPVPAETSADTPAKSAE